MYLTHGLSRINAPAHQAILSELANGVERHAYQLRKQLAAAGSVPPQYNLYLALHSLARRGLVASRIERGANKLAPRSQVLQAHG